MAVALVVFNGTRVNAADSNTNWGNYVIGGGSPAAEAQIAYQNAAAVNKKIVSTTARQGVDYNHGSNIDMTPATGTDVLWFVKVNVSDSFSLNTTWGIEVSIGSADTSNFHQYNIAGSGSNLSVYNDYPIQGGYLLTSIDPNRDVWAEVADSGGAFNQASVNWWAVGAQFATGAAKTENVAMDSIDTGTGLTITAGDGASTEGDFTDFLTFDQDTSANRYGVVTGSGDLIRSHGLLTIGTASVTEFLDTASIVLFPDGYHSAGLVGVAVGMSNASSIMQIDSLLIGEGTIQAAAADDTRPDFIVTGTSGTFSCAATMRNFRNVTFTSICDVADADIEAELLTQASANISNSTIRTNAITSVATLQDPTFGISTDMHDVDFIQSGAGHAIELSTVDGTFTLTNITFTGYGADTTNDAALDITAASGTTTINFTGTQPTHKTAGATVVFVNSVIVTITVIDSSSNPVPTAQVAVYKTSDDSEVMNEDTETVTAGSFVTGVKYIIITVGTTDFTAIGAASNTVGVVFTATGSGSGTGTASNGIAVQSVGYTSDFAVYIRVRKSSSGETKYIPFSSTGTVISSGFSLTATLLIDLNAN